MPTDVRLQIQVDKVVIVMDSYKQALMAAASLPRQVTSTWFV